jgi:hypothetical protein
MLELVSPSFAQFHMLLTIAITGKNERRGLFVPSVSIEGPFQWFNCARKLNAESTRGGCTEIRSPLMHVAERAPALRYPPLGRGEREQTNAGRLSGRF